MDIQNYEEYTSDAIWQAEKSDYYTDKSVKIKNGIMITRIGRIVYCKIKAHLLKIDMGIITIHGIPEKFKPKSDSEHTIKIWVDHEEAHGTLRVEDRGVIYISPFITKYRLTGNDCSINMTCDILTRFYKDCKGGLSNDVEVSWHC